MSADPRIPPERRKGLFTRLKEGLSRSRNALKESVAAIFTKRRLDDAMLEELEDVLISADLGVAAAGRITAHLARERYDREVSDEDVRRILADEIAALLSPAAQPLVIDPSHKPHIILVVGVNGGGKTTTIGKLASRFRAEGKSVMLAAGDTFRAAAIEQLQIWGERTGAPVIARPVGSDAAGLVYEAVEAAQAQATDVLLIDTAGRLQNKTSLMAELEKITRVIKKRDPSAPHSVLLVLDATTGQNALSQVEAFKDVAHVTGLIMTKLDGTARGGILVALTEKFGLPIHAIGVGEGIEDLQPFEAHSFAEALTGLHDTIASASG